MQYSVQELWKSSMSLGEGLFIQDNSLYFLDINESQLMVLNDASQKSIPKIYELPEQASAIWKVDNNSVYLATESGIAKFNLPTSNWSIVCSLPAEHLDKNFRANDGGELFSESYLFGTMEKAPTGLNGAIYLYQGGTIEQVYQGIAIPNTFVRLNPVEILISDSFEQKIYKYVFCSTKRIFLEKHIWLDLSSEHFVPDGGCIDSEGNIYIAMWDGARINKYDPHANLLQSYDLPAIRPTNCKLSEDQKTLYVTTATEGLSQQLIEQYPLSGSVLEVKLG